MTVAKKKLSGVVLVAMAGVVNSVNFRPVAILDADQAAEAGIKDGDTVYVSDKSKEVEAGVRLKNPTKAMVYKVDRSEVADVPNARIIQGGDGWLVIGKPVS